MKFLLEFGKNFTVFMIKLTIFDFDYSHENRLQIRLCVTQKVWEFLQEFIFSLISPVISLAETKKIGSPAKEGLQ